MPTFPGHEYTGPQFIEGHGRPSGGRVDHASRRHDAEYKRLGARAYVDPVLSYGADRRWLRYVGNYNSLAARIGRRYFRAKTRLGRYLMSKRKMSNEVKVDFRTPTKRKLIGQRASIPYRRIASMNYDKFKADRRAALVRTNNSVLRKPFTKSMTVNETHTARKKPIVKKGPVIKRLFVKWGPTTPMATHVAHEYANLTTAACLRNSVVNTVLSPFILSKYMYTPRYFAHLVKAPGAASAFGVTYDIINAFNGGQNARSVFCLPDAMNDQIASNNTNVYAPWRVVMSAPAYSGTSGTGQVDLNWYGQQIMMGKARSRVFVRNNDKHTCIVKFYKIKAKMDRVVTTDMDTDFLLQLNNELQVNYSGSNWGIRTAGDAAEEALTSSHYNKLTFKMGALHKRGMLNKFFYIVDEQILYLKAGEEGYFQPVDFEFEFNLANVIGRLAKLGMTVVQAPGAAASGIIGGPDNTYVLRNLSGAWMLSVEGTLAHDSTTPALVGTTPARIDYKCTTEYSWCYKGGIWVSVPSRYDDATGDGLVFVDDQNPGVFTS